MIIKKQTGFENKRLKLLLPALGSNHKQTTLRVKKTWIENQRDDCLNQLQEAITNHLEKKKTRNKHDLKIREKIA